MKNRQRCKRTTGGFLVLNYFVLRFPTKREATPATKAEMTRPKKAVSYEPLS